MSIATWMARELCVDNHDRQRRTEGYNRALLGHMTETQ